MADFSFLSDTDESAVEELLAEAMDDCVLKQVAAINCSSFSHSVLPSHLESRFQRLKTFPSSSKPETPLVPNSKTELKDNLVSGDLGKVSEGKGVSERKSRSGYVSSLSDSLISSSGHADSPKLNAKPGDRKVKEGKSPSGSFSFRSDALDSPAETVKSGCFCCSPKKVSRKKSVKRDPVADLGLDWGKHDEILGDLKSFSSKEQKKLMKKAMKEEEKINKEAEKIVKWAKQASARFDISVIDDELSDDDNGHNSRHH